MFTGGMFGSVTSGKDLKNIFNYHLKCSKASTTDLQLHVGAPVVSGLSIIWLNGIDVL